MWYIIIKTNVGRLDLGRLGLHYKTKRDAEEAAELAKSLPETLDVWVCRRK